jgi:thioredoxin 1
MGEHVKEVNDQNFEKVVLQSEVPVLVDFWAPWCERS